MPGQCCVFQIFDDGGAYDKRYDEVISPAITAAGLEPYRVDRDAGAEIPIDTLHEEIRRSLVCLADITPDNPNVWYELSFAVASDRRSRTQHRDAAMAVLGIVPADRDDLQERANAAIRHAPPAHYFL